MRCNYCRTWNSEDDQRCMGCERLLKAPQMRPISGASYGATRGSLAHAYQYEEQRQAPSLVAEAPPEMPLPMPRPKHFFQALLFPASVLPDVIPIEWASPNAKRRKASSSKGTRGGQRTRRHRSADQLELWPEVEIPRGRQLESTEEALICCDAPVAHRTLRLLAGALDFGLIAILTAAFALTVYVAGAALPVNAGTGVVLALIPVCIGLLYKTVFCLANGDSPGTSWTQLHLLNFDGRRPGRAQRFCRLAGAVLSILAAGLGIIWALGDEETLTWHDHMSNTYPAVRQL